MKKRILTAMLFIAFLFVGIQNVSAQYVSSTDAMNLLTTEMQNIENNAIYSQTLDTHSDYSNLVFRLNFFTAVYEGILVGEDVPTSISMGIEESDPRDEFAGQQIDPILQEVKVMLSL